MPYDVQLGRNVQSCPLAVVRRRVSPGQLAKVVPECCGIVWNAIRLLNVKGVGRHVALHLDDQINLEVGVELDAPFVGSGEVIGSSLPAGEFATAVHFGPYSELHFAHQAIRDFCASQGCAVAGPNWEIYGHWDDAWNSDPSKIRTDVFYLLAARRKTTG